jgi:hypothetical protein
VARYNDRYFIHFWISPSGKYLLMATIVKRRRKSARRELTLTDLADRFGPMPSGRILLEPLPGTATAKDVLAIHRRYKRLCELVDGVLVEKAMGYEESMLAIEISALLRTVICPRKLGVIAGESVYIAREIHGRQGRTNADGRKSPSRLQSESRGHFFRAGRVLIGNYRSEDF